METLKDDLWSQFNEKAASSTITKLQNEMVVSKQKFKRIDENRKGKESSLLGYL